MRCSRGEGGRAGGALCKFALAQVALAPEVAPNCSQESLLANRERLLTCGTRQRSDNRAALLSLLWASGQGDTSKRKPPRYALVDQKREQKS